MDVLQYKARADMEPIMLYTTQLREEMILLLVHSSLRQQSAPR